MKIVIFGSTGLIGKILTEELLKLGHEVTAYVRNPSKIKFNHENLHIVNGELKESSKIDLAIQSKDLVISVLGPTSLTKESTEFMEGIKNIVSAVKKNNPKQFFYLSTMGVSDSRDCLDWFSKKIIMDLIIKKSVEAHTTNENLIVQSNSNWIIFRPAKLTNNTQKEEFETSEYFTRAFRPKISRSSVVKFMIEQIGNPKNLHKKISIKKR
ncbi:MAG: NAD(P)H-binding protein [Leptospiraceae bacterium]|nr:NAD(P)H-binding protein [Leptospiraceae bacterium]